MLGRLFSTLSPSTSRSDLESTLEEAHTRELLFAQSDVPARFASSRTSNFDDNQGFELDEKNLRVLIVQDADQDKSCVLLDTKTPQPPLPPTPSTPQAQPAQRHIRTPSHVGPRSPIQIPNGTPGSRNRSTTFSGAPASHSLRDIDAKDSTNGILDSIFGGLGTAKTGSSTKMHVIPAASPMNLGTASAIFGARPRREPLNRAQTYSQIPASYPGERSGHDIVLITRIFNVDLPDFRETSAMAKNEPTTSASNDTTPFSPYQKPPKVRVIKAPSFAIALLVELPRVTASRPASRHIGSPQAPSASSSYGSDMHSSWASLEALSSSLGSSVCLAEHTDIRIEHLVRSWDIIVQSLTALEHAAKVQILDHLKDADAKSSANVAKTPKKNQRMLHLDPTSLSDTSLQIAAAHVIRRIARGISIPRVKVVRGLLPGGHWLDVARTCALQQQKFFYQLLTAFLGFNIDRLSRHGSLASFDHGERAYEQTADSQGWEVSRNRTVILSRSRSQARRLVFLLASFLQSQSPNLSKSAAAKGQRLPNSSSVHSPPSGQFSRKESLRREANRRIRQSRLNSQTPETQILTNSPSSSNFPERSSGVQTLVKPAFVRKGSTTSTTTPIPNTPVPYFASGSQSDSYFPTVSATENSAANDLARYLRQRGSDDMTNSNGTSAASTKWGSLLTGFWSGKSNSLTSNPTTSSVEDPSIRKSSIDSHTSPNGPRVNGGETTVDSNLPSPDHAITQDSIQSSPRPIPPRLHVDANAGVVDVELNIPDFFSSSLDAERRLPARSRSRPSPATSSIDGATSVHSTKSWADALSYKESDPDRIAGYLRRYHEDFILQACAPYPEVEADIKASMSSEANLEIPSVAGLESAVERDSWAEVSTTLIADVSRLAVTKVTLTRKVPSVGPIDISGTGAGTITITGNNINRAEERFNTETILNFDKTLAEAIERALGEPTVSGSRTPSPSQQTHSRVGSSSFASTTPPPTFSLRDPRKVVLGALEEVISSVRDSSERGRNISQLGTTPTPALARSVEKEGNVLREGVKRWMRSVDHTEVW